MIKKTLYVLKNVNYHLLILLPFLGCKDPLHKKNEPNAISLDSINKNKISFSIQDDKNKNEISLQISPSYSSNSPLGILQTKDINLLKNKGFSILDINSKGEVVFVENKKHDTCFGVTIFQVLLNQDKKYIIATDGSQEYKTFSQNPGRLSSNGFFVFCEKENIFKIDGDNNKTSFLIYLLARGFEKENNLQLTGLKSSVLDVYEPLISGARREIENPGIIRRSLKKSSNQIPTLFEKKLTSFNNEFSNFNKKSSKEGNKKSEEIYQSLIIKPGELLGEGGFAKVDIIEIEGKKYARRIEPTCYTPPCSEEEILAKMNNRSSFLVQESFHSAYPDLGFFKTHLSFVNDKEFVSIMELKVKGVEYLPNDQAKKAVSDLNKQSQVYKKGIPYEGGTLHFIHGDFKLDNAMIGIDGKASYLDFGNSKIVFQKNGEYFEVELDSNGNIQKEKPLKINSPDGTLLYFPPEAITPPRGSMSSREIFNWYMNKEIHSANMTAYEMIHHKVPFEMDKMGMLDLFDFIELSGHFSLKKGTEERSLASAEEVQKMGERIFL